MGPPVAAAAPPQLPMGMPRPSPGGLAPAHAARLTPPPLTAGPPPRELSGSLSDVQRGSNAGVRPVQGPAGGLVPSTPAAQAGPSSGIPPARAQGSAAAPLPVTPERPPLPSLRPEVPQANGLMRKADLQGPSPNPIVGIAPEAPSPSVKAGASQDALDGPGLPSAIEGNHAPSAVEPPVLQESSIQGPSAGEPTLSAPSVSEPHQSGPFAAAAVPAPLFGSAGVDDDMSFFSEYGDGVLLVLCWPKPL